MIRTMLKFGFFLLIGVLGYNYFFGSTEEKESSQRIFQEFKVLGTMVKNLVVSEKQKFDTGKYDVALSKINSIYIDLQEKAQRTDNVQLIDKLKDLSTKKQNLENQLSDLKDQQSIENTKISLKEKQKIEKSTKEKQESLRTNLDDLLKETEQLINTLNVDEQ